MPLQVARAHSPARQYQTSPIAMDRMPPHGLDMGRRLDCSRALQGWHVGQLSLHHCAQELKHHNLGLLAGTISRLDMLICSAAWPHSRSALVHVKYLGQNSRGDLGWAILCFGWLWGIFVWVQGVKDFEHLVCDCAYLRFFQNPSCTGDFQAVAGNGCAAIVGGAWGRCGNPHQDVCQWLATVDLVETSYGMSCSSSTTSIKYPAQ
jgi:hypothetical protein